MIKGKLVYVAFVYLLFSLIIIYDGLSSDSSTLYILKSLAVLWIWLTPSFIVMYYSDKRLSPLIDLRIAENVAVMLGLLVLLLTYVAIYYLSLSIGPVFLVKPGKSLFESVKPFVVGVGFLIIAGTVHIIYVIWKR